MSMHSAHARVCSEHVHACVQRTCTRVFSARARVCSAHVHVCVQRTGACVHGCSAYHLQDVHAYAARDMCCHACVHSTDGHAFVIGLRLTATDCTLDKIVKYLGAEQVLNEALPVSPQVVGRLCANKLSVSLLNNLKL
jgi:hypothetical protein